VSRKHFQSGAFVVAAMAALTLGGRFFGFIREVVLANYFGTTYVVDAYVMAINVPTIIFGGILASVSVSFIPIYARLHADEGRLSADLFASRVINALTLVAMVISILGICFAPQLVSAFAYGWHDNSEMAKAIDLCVFFTRFTFAVLLFNAVAELQNAWQRFYHHYYVPIIADYLQNAFIIGFVIFAAYFGQIYIIFGLLFGYMSRWFIGAAAIRLRGFRHKWDFKLGKAVQHVVALAIPVFIGSYLNQITVAVDKIMASGLPEGSVAALNYGVLVSNLFAVLIGTMLTQYLYPKMAKSYVSDATSEWIGQLRTGIAMICILGIPTMLGLLLYSHPIIELVYERGAFNMASSELTQTCFLWYTTGLVFQMLIGFLTQAYYSRGDTKTPIIMSAICACINVVGNLLLVDIMGIGGIALSTSIAFALNAIMLCFALRRYSKRAFTSVDSIGGDTAVAGDSGSVDNDGNSLSDSTVLFGRFFVLRTAKILIASICAVAVSWPVYNGVIAVASAPLGDGFAAFFSLVCAVFVCAVAYYILLRVLRVKEVYIIHKLLPWVGSK